MGRLRLRESDLKRLVGAAILEAITLRNSRFAKHSVIGRGLPKSLDRLPRFQLLESLADDASAFAARPGDGRKGWAVAAKSLAGVPAAKHLLAWMANPLNVPLEEPLEEVLPLLRDWARARDENRLLPAEKDLSRLTRTGLEAFDKRMSIGRSMEIRMPREGHLFEVAGDAAPGGGRTTWVVYFPETPGESCAIAELVSPGNEGYRIDWCTARRKNNQFYGYAASGTLLYYVVNKGKPEEKYSIGMVRDDGGKFQLVEPRNDDVTVSWQNLAFDPAEAFGSAWTGILRGIREHAQRREMTGHPIAQEVLAAAQDEESWRVLKRKTSDDPVHLWQLFSPLVEPTEVDAKRWGVRGGMIAMKPTIAMDLPLAAVKASASNPWMADDAVDAAKAVIEEYASEVPSSRVDAIVKAIEEHDLKNPSWDGRYTVGDRVISMLTADRRARVDVPAAIAALPSRAEGMREWFAQNVKLLPTRATLIGQQESLRKSAAAIASRMSDEQLLVMVNPFAAFVGLRDDVPSSARRYEPTPEIWLRELFLRMAVRGHPRAWSGTSSEKSERLASLERSLYNGRWDGVIGRIMVDLQEVESGRAEWMDHLSNAEKDIFHVIRKGLTAKGWMGS